LNHITPELSLPIDTSDIVGKDGHEKRPFISVLYRCCNSYGRLYPNKDGTKFVGRCPRCGARTEALIGPTGTTRNYFEAR
jgi:hypothetical protein